MNEEKKLKELRASIDSLDEDLLELISARARLALDIAKVILDNGFHAPTIYFPINISESIMIEPTETESKETLDRFIELMLEIDRRIDSDIDNLLDSPSRTPVGRLNETKANRELNLNWKNEL